jgi:hypothetical protein
LQTEDVGLARLRNLHGTAIDAPAFRRFTAYLSQAETYYLSAQNMPPESRPLVAYYLSLNLTKAFLMRRRRTQETAKSGRTSP